MSWHSKVLIVLLLVALLLMGFWPQIAAARKSGRVIAGAKESLAAMVGSGTDSLLSEVGVDALSSTAGL
jgi:hypothetical protein